MTMADDDSSLPDIEHERDYGYNPPPSPPPIEPEPETGYNPPPPPPETVIDVNAEDSLSRGYNPPPPPPPTEES